MKIKSKFDYKNIDSEEDLISIHAGEKITLSYLLKEKVMSIKEYLDNASTFERKVRDMISNCNGFSVFYLENKYTVGTEDTRWQTDGIFKSIIAVEERIENFMDRIEEYSEEDVSECMWWEITKYVNSKGYKRIYTIYLSADQKLLGLEFDNEFLLNDIEKAVYQEYKSQKNILE